MTDSDRNHSQHARLFLPQNTAAGPEQIAADAAKTALKRQLLDEALYFDDLNDRAAPMSDDTDA